MLLDSIILAAAIIFTQQQLYSLLYLVLNRFLYLTVLFAKSPIILDISQFKQAFILRVIKISFAFQTAYFKASHIPLK